MARATSAWDLFEKPEYRSHLSWGCCVLDAATGGIRRHGITEVRVRASVRVAPVDVGDAAADNSISVHPITTLQLAGEAGVGKTQWLLSALVQVCR